MSSESDSMIPEPPKSALAEKAAYFDMLRLWVAQAKMHQSASQCFPYFLMANHAPPVAASLQRPASDGARNQREEVVLGPNGGGFEFIIAPIWKRFVAETIDVAILFMIKLFFTFAIVDILNIDLGAALDLNSIKTTIEDDYTQLFSLASEIIVVELITKVVVCIYETLWTAEGSGNMGGATPGKLVMGIRILYVETVQIVDPPEAGGQVNYLNNRVKALLFPAKNPGWRRALCRALIKNATVIIPVVYPVYFITFMFRNNRMGYDVLTKTIVVEENQMPILRRL